MLVKLLTNERLALMMTIITAATAGVMLQEGYAAIIQMEVALYILFGGITSLYLLGNVGRRSTYFTDKFRVSVSNILFIAFYLLMTQSSYDMTELVFYVDCCNYFWYSFRGINNRSNAIFRIGIWYIIGYEIN